MKRVIIIRSSNKPARVIKEAVSLKKAGYSVDILYWDRNTNKSRIETNDGISIRYFGLKAPYGKLSLIPYLFLWWIYEFIFLLNNNYDVMHACCFDTIIPPIFIKLLKKKKIVYDIFDFYSESLPSSIPKKIAYWVSNLEKFCIQFADCVIIVDESRYVQIKGSKIQNLEVIMNCPVDILVKSDNNSKNDNFTIFYGGMISKTRGLNELLNAINDEPSITLVVAGMGEDEDLYRSKFENKKNIIYLGWINYQKYIELTAQSDIVFGFYDPGIPNNKLASPNKLFEAMMCKTPVIINEETSMKEIVSNEKCGIITPYDNINLLRESILKLKNNPEIASEMGLNGRKAFETKYNWNIMEKKLCNLYLKIC